VVVAGPGEDGRAVTLDLLFAVAVSLQGPLPEIKAEVARYVTAVNEGDPRVVAELYQRGAGASTLGDGHITLGWDSVAASYREAYRSLRSIRMEIPGDSVTVVALGDDAALALFPYRWTLGPAGRGIVLRGAMTLVYRRTPAGWRIVHDHTSTLQGAEQPAALPAGGPAGPRRATENCVVTRVTDGDSIECASIGRVRLIGIDAPEGDQQPAGDAARDALERLIPVGARIQLEGDVEPSDRYGRRLAYAWRDGMLVNWMMVRQGWAVLLTYPPNVQWVAAFEEAQRLAREERVGLGGPGGYDCLPSLHRRGEC
jgi:micrococcal nuclease